VKLWLKIAVFFALVFGVGIGVVWQQIHAQRMVQDKTVWFEHGTSLQGMARTLQKDDVISSSILFRIWAKWRGESEQLKAGEYYFSGQLAMPDVLALLLEGKVVMHHVTVAEGLRTLDVLDVLAKQTHTDLNRWQQALDSLLGKQQEGYLLPETYTYSLPVRPKYLLKHMLDAQENILKGLGKAAAEKVRIMASIIEKETALKQERPWVAAVIRNRLKVQMPLQMDPTVIYGMWKRDGEFSGNIHRKDLHTDTPWNTYTRKGLPPTPICNPSVASLQAAMHPADVDYLYFVADGTGGHAFASTLAEHQRNVTAWVRLERQK